MALETVWASLGVVDDSLMTVPGSVLVPPTCSVSGRDVTESLCAPFIHGPRSRRLETHFGKELRWCVFDGLVEKRSLRFAVVGQPSLVAGPVFKTGEGQRELSLASSIPVLYRQLFRSLLVA